MDCCNYMQYRHQSYYESQYYHDPLPPYHGELYGQQFYQDYYGSTPYYPQQWPCTTSFPDYVYNPKEARIRKAMREATRDRSIGASPMLPRPNARRLSSHWMASHDEPLMLAPITGMRSPLDSPACNFPISGPAGAGFMSPMNGYSKMETHLPPATPVHSSYIQQNPLAQLQHQTELWHPYQETMRPRSSGNSFMEISTYSQQQQSGTTLQQQQPVKTSEVTRLIVNEKDAPTTTAESSSRSAITISATQNDNQSSSVSVPSTNEQKNTDNGENSTNVSHYVTGPESPPHTNDNVSPEVTPTVNGHDIDDILTTQNKPTTTQYNDKLIVLHNNENPQHEDPFVPIFKDNTVRNSYNNVSVKSKKLHPSSNHNNQVRQNNLTRSKLSSSKALPDFNEAFGSTERGRFQSPPDPRFVSANKEYLDYFFDANNIKFDDY